MGQKRASGLEQLAMHSCLSYYVLTRVFYAIIKAKPKMPDRKVH